MKRAALVFRLQLGDLRVQRRQVRRLGPAQADTPRQAVAQGAHQVEVGR